MLDSKREVINQLKKEILLLEGFKPSLQRINKSFGLGPIENAFPNHIFPQGVIHEFIIDSPEQSAASTGFVSALLKTLMNNTGICIWISNGRKPFPPAIKVFGVEPDRIIFIDLHRDKEALWTTEEALKYDGLAAVVTDIKEITFTQSRRLQLAIEDSKVTGIILRNGCEKLNPTACTARWRISPLPSLPEADMPGIGYPRWSVELLKVRNGVTGSWQVEWYENRFHIIDKAAAAYQEGFHQTLNTG